MFSRQTFSCQHEFFIDFFFEKFRIVKWFWHFVEKSAVRYSQAHFLSSNGVSPGVFVWKPILTIVLLSSFVQKNQDVFLAFVFCVSTGIFSVALSWKKFLSDIDLIFSAHSFKRSFNVSGLAFLAKSELKKSYPEICFGPRTRNFKAGVS